MRVKYIEERFRRYFIFGEDGDCVDVSDGDGDIVTRVTKKEAEALIDDRDRVVSALIASIQAHGERAYEVFESIAYPKEAKDG